jgi:ABC-2 type transport system permease protein
MNNLVYIRYEMLRAFRNRRFFFFSLGFPLLFYFVIASPNRHVQNFDGSGISLPLYYMVGLTSFGTMVAMISTGTRIASERQLGWTRQLRITPLRTRAYFRAKLLTAYMMSGLTIALLALAGASLGVRLPAGH